MGDDLKRRWWLECGEDQVAVPPSGRFEPLPEELPDGVKRLSLPGDLPKLGGLVLIVGRSEAPTEWLEFVLRHRHEDVQLCCETSLPPPIGGTVRMTGRLSGPGGGTFAR